MTFKVLNTKAYKTLPEVLFYKRPKKSIMRPPQIEFVAFSIRDSKNWGELIVHKTDLELREDYSGDTLAIDFIKSKQPHQGLGRAMIEFAKNYSKELGCQGYLVLKSVNFLNKKEVPHIFYRKQNFSTLDKKIDKKLDFYIRKKRNATSEDFSTMLMFYPPKK